MFENLKQKKQDLQDTANMVIDCQNGVISSILQQMPYVLVFKTTHWCWNNCAHCCESAGSSMPKNFIPEQVINGYVDQAVQDKNFSREIVFTGGEITSAYKFAGEDYISNIINHALNAKCSVDIKTNAGWVNSPLAATIYSDLDNIVRDQSKNSDDNIKKIIHFQVSLSLDSFHKDALMRDFKFLEHFANTDTSGVTFTVNVSSVKQDKNMFYELLDKLIDSGINVDELFMTDSAGNFVKKMYALNGNVVIFNSNGTLFNGGRAKDIKYAFKTPFPQFTFLTPDHKSLVAFDSFGNVTLGENSGKKISVPWRDQENGQALSLETICSDIVVATKTAEQDFLKQHRYLNAYINWLRRQVVK